MGKMMTLEHLSSIKGAQSSTSVEELFKTIKNAPLNPNNKASETQHINLPADLRADEIKRSSEAERAIIKANFPKEKNGYLVVSKVIEG